MTRALAIVGVLAIASACSRNPATGRLQFGLPSETDEVALGREAAAEVAVAMPIYDEVPSATKIVADVGAKIAAKSERPELPWSFTLVDDPAVNAFALPGGFVYVTRGLLAHLGSDDELAAVLAHEAGHVTARHGVVQLRKQNTARRSVGLFRVIDPNLRHVGGIAAHTAGLALLRYSREDEHEADDLAVRYVTDGGWNTASLVRVFAILASLPSVGEKPPPWLSTHPDPGLRRARTAQKLGIPEAQSPSAEPEFLAAIEGLAYGNDPRDGFLIGELFVHPRRGFMLSLPPKWKVLHDRDQVVAISEDEQTVFITLPTKYADRKEALADFFAESSMTAGAAYEGKVDGFDVASRAFAMADEAGNKTMGLVAFIDYQGKVIAMVAIGPESTWVQHADRLAQTFGSFARIVDPRMRSVEPPRIHTIVLDRPSTIEDLAKRTGVVVDAPTLAILNGVDVATSLPQGWPIKLPQAKP
jgi:predicted Zn-dependent protease